MRARRSAAIAAGKLPDTKLGIGLDNFPISGPPAFSLTRENMTMERVGIEQDVPNLAKRHAQQNRAEADITAARARSQADLRRIRVATALAWIDSYYAQKRPEAMDVVLERLRPPPGPPFLALASGHGPPSTSPTLP